MNLDASARQFERQHLQGLSKPHIVRKTGAQPRRERPTEIVDARLLVRTQDAAESVWPIRSHIGLRLRERRQEFL